MARITADSMIQSLTAKDPENPLYQVLYLMNKDLQAARDVADKVSSIITMATSPQPPSPSTNAQAIIYFDPVTLQLMVSQNGSPYDYLVQNAPAARCYTLTVQSIPNDAVNWSMMTFAAADVVFDPHGMFDGVNKMTAPAPGIYLAGSEVGFTSSTKAGTRLLQNGVTSVGEMDIDGTGVSAFPRVTTILKLNKGDFVQSQVIQVSAGALNTAVKGFYMIRIGGSA